ncbi:hypothetical protein ABIB26_004705 [Arthrobacter sp. UYEF20]
MRGRQRSMCLLVQAVARASFVFVVHNGIVSPDVFSGKTMRGDGIIAN